MTNRALNGHRSPQQRTECQSEPAERSCQPAGGPGVGLGCYVPAKQSQPCQRSRCYNTEFPHLLGSGQQGDWSLVRHWQVK